MRSWKISDVVGEFNLNESFVFLDLGTNKGQELEVLLPLGVEVHSFEPYKKQAEYILNRFGDFSNLIFNHRAAWIANETRDFYFQRNPNIEDGLGDYDMGSSLFSEKINIDGKFVDVVECVDMSEYVLSLDKQINIMKIDCEGVEFHIIRHLIESNAIERIDNIFFEDHTRRFPLSCVDFYENKKFVYDQMESLNTNFGYW